MKKILFLGAALHQSSIIKLAKEKGYYVITSDNVPSNPGHNYADRTYNVSTIDKDGVLKIAADEKVSGVIGYASDAAAPSVAYISEKLQLAGNPYNSVRILTNKDLYREFLQKNGFHTPRARVCETYEEAIRIASDFKFPVMVKPVDSSGCKGVSKINSLEELSKAYESARNRSIRKAVIIEEFVKKQGYQISGDIFAVDGVVKFWSFGNEYYFNDGTVADYVPMGEFWPSLWSDNIINKLISEIQRLISILDMKTTAFNVEAIVDNYNDIYIMELGPRNGGSWIPDLIALSTGVDLQEYTLKAALGEDCGDISMSAEQTGFWSNYNIPSFREGKFVSLEIDKDFREKHIIKCVSNHKKGDLINKFANGSDAVGLAIMKFDSMEQMLSYIDRLPELIQVKVE